MHNHLNMSLVLLSLLGCAGAQTDHLAQGRSALQAGDIQTAAIEAALAIEFSDDPYAAQKLYAKTQRELASQREQLDDLSGALDHLDRAIEAEPTPAERVDDALHAAELAFRVEGKDPIDYLSAAVRFNPSSVEARSAAASAFDEAGMASEAIPHYLWLWDREPTELRYAARLAALYAAEQRYTDAAAVYARILTVQPDNVQAAFGCVDALVALKRFDEAERLLLATKKTYPNNPMVLYRWADFLDSVGREDEAAAVRKTAQGELPGVNRRRMRKLR